MNIRDSANVALNILADLIANNRLPPTETAKLMRLERILSQIAQLGDTPIPNRNDIETAAGSR